MAFTFNPALSSLRDKVRLRIGDTDAKNAELDDETIDALLVESANIWLKAALECALRLQAKYARIVEITVDHQTSRGNQIAAAYAALATSIFADIQRANLAATAALPGLEVTGIGDTRGPYDYPGLPDLNVQ